MGSFWHGGAAGLRPGELIDAHHDRHWNDCVTCRERAAGISQIDAPNGRPGKVYITTDREYARHYASLAGYGDLYQVEPVGELELSTEDRFETFTCDAARVTAVYDRAVMLTDSQRRKMMRRWIEADARHDGWLDRLEAMSPADRRRYEDKQMAQLWRSAHRNAAASRAAVSQTAR